jgi:Protein of unknown function (DUF2605)
MNHVKLKTACPDKTQIEMLTPGSDLPESDFLKSLLQPLLEDFQYWFGRSRTLLESHQIDFLSREQQAAVLARVQQAQQEVTATQLLFHAMDGQAGVETSVLVPWHQLVTECWQIGMKFRMEHPDLVSSDAAETSAREES